MLPAAPQPAYFDEARETWILSRHGDVAAALNEQFLKPVGYSGDLAAVRVRTQSALSAATLRMWQSRIEPLASGVASALTPDSSVDLVHDFAAPLCVSIACIVTGAAVDDKELFELAAVVSAAAADPSDPQAKAAAAAAGRELERRIPAESIPMAASAFVALAHTLPAFLANAWLALLRHPTELARLQDESAFVPGAVEELMRYAGLARTLRRVATAAVGVGDAKIAAGQRVMLLLNSANRDPAVFPHPNRLDVSRPIARHFAFGAGPHSCPAASLIRMAAAAVTMPLIGRLGHAQVREPVEWRGGSGFRTPAALWVIPQSESA